MNARGVKRPSRAWMAIPNATAAIVGSQIWPLPSGSPRSPPRLSLRILASRSAALCIAGNYRASTMNYQLPREPPLPHPEHPHDQRRGGAEEQTDLNDLRHG